MFSLRASVITIILIVAADVDIGSQFAIMIF